MKKIKSIFSVVALLVLTNIANAVDLPTPPEVKSESYIVTDFETGKILIAKDEEKALSPASVTKLMTVYVVLKEIKKGIITENDVVKISKNAVLTAKNTKSSRTFLEIGDQVTVKELLKGLIVQSGNDAAISLAEHVAGRESSFAELMNIYATNLGMERSQFQNASGLPEKNHYTTSKDLSKIMMAIIREFPEEYAYYFSIKSYTYNNIKQSSRNQLIFSNPEFDGGKTGWHNTAEYCYVASVVKNGRRLVVVTLKSPHAKDRFNDAVALTNYGYRYFDNHTLIEKGESIDGIDSLPVFMSNVTNAKIVPDTTITLTLERGEYEKLTANININDKIIAPMSSGDIVGKIEIKLEDKILGESNLILSEDIKEGSWFEVAKDSIAMKFFK